MHPERVAGIGVIIVNYATPPDMLVETVSALVAGISSADPLLEVLVIDNASPKWRDTARDRVVALDPRVRWIDRGTNGGFAAGVNTGLAALTADADLVFLCNPDARVEPDALALSAAALRSQPASCLSAAPKMLLVPQPAHDTPVDRVIDSIGHAVNGSGEAFNVGMGQPDIGQYDRPAACFGPCFGAAMFRRHAFEPSAVGRLDETYFLYYEDVAWNWRAQLLGYTSVTVPDAEVHHHLSVTMRDRPYDETFRLNERNLMVCALSYFGIGRALAVVSRRKLGILKGSLTGRHYPIAGLRALLGVGRRLPHIVRERRDVQTRRVRSDAQIVAFAMGERTFFDAVARRPIDRAAATAEARARLSRPG